MEITIEYLIVYNSKDSGSFCSNIPSFKRLLEVNADLKLTNKRLTYKTNFSCSVGITTGKISDQSERFYNLRITRTSTHETADADIETYLLLLRDIRQIIGKSGADVIDEVWNDISYYFSQKAYNKIYIIENLMRKLIATFMQTKVGTKWFSETSPVQIKEAVSKAKRKGSQVSPLHSLDFIHLSDYLLSPYQRQTPDELYKAINRSRKAEDLDLSRLRELVPQSNWDKYFGGLVDCDASYLKSKWQDLYELRCQIAHNAPFSKFDHDTVNKLFEEIEPKLRKAIEKLDEITITPDDIETISENVAGSINECIGEFIIQWKILENSLIVLARTQELQQKRNIHLLIKEMTMKKILSEEDGALLHELSMLRNRIVHLTDNFGEEAIRNGTRQIREFITFKLDPILYPGIV